MGESVAEPVPVAPGAILPTGVASVPIESLKPNPDQPRKQFTRADHDELTQSIRDKGVLQPILVRQQPGEDGVWQIIAGERRWRAAQAARLTEVPIIVREMDDLEVLEVAIIENVQRADLNPLEEAAGYEQLMEQFGYIQADLAKTVGKSRSHVANTMRLSKLPDSVKALVNDGALSAGHARALLSVADPEAVARRVAANGLTVRDVERIAQSEAEGGGTKTRQPRREKDTDTKALEKALADVTGLAVVIDHKGGAGQMTI
eukprot:gene47073-63043_t